MPRLSVNISDEVAELVQDYTKRKGVSATEATRRAFSMLAYVDDLSKQEASVYVRFADGTVREAVFLV